MVRKEIIFSCNGKKSIADQYRSCVATALTIRNACYFFLFFETANQYFAEQSLGCRWRRNPTVRLLLIDFADSSTNLFERERTSVMQGQAATLRATVAEGVNVTFDWNFCHIEHRSSTPHLKNNNCLEVVCQTDEQVN